MNLILLLYAAIIGLTTLVAVQRSSHNLPVFAFLLITCVTSIGAKLMLVCGQTTNVGNIFYAGVTFAMSVKFCLYGRDAAMSTLRVVFIGLVAITAFRQLAIWMPVLPGDETRAAAATYIFKISLPLTTASFIAFYTAQSVNIYLLGRLRHWPGWLRKIGANTVAEAVDSFIFFPIAFGQSWSHQQIAVAMLAGFALKTVLNILDTPVWLWLCRRQAVANSLEALTSEAMRKSASQRGS